MFLDDERPNTPEERFEQTVRLVLSLCFPDSHAALEMFQSMEQADGVEAVKPIRDETRKRWIVRQAELRQAKTHSAK